jgi:hypothetical protein
VSLRHELERELASLAARWGHDTIDAEEYINRRLQFSQTSEYERHVKTPLGLAGLDGYNHMETLRHIANSYQHDAFSSASTRLIQHLNLPPTLKYAPLVGSHQVRVTICRDLG